MSEGTEAIRPVIPQGEGPDDVGTPIDAAKKELNNLIEALAVMIVVICVIPILVLVFFVWLMNVIFGVAIKTPDWAGRPKLLPHPGAKK